MLNSYKLTKLSLVYAMFNSHIFQEVKNNIDLIERYYLTDSTTMTNTLIRKLLDSIRMYDISSIDEPLFRSILANEGKTDLESESILNEIIKYKVYDEKQIKPIRDHIRGIGNQALISLAASKYPNDPEGYVKFLKTSEYKKDTSNIMTTINFSQLDINSIISKSSEGWESHYRFINETYDPLFKYETGQMALVMAPPGCFTGDTRVMLSDGTGITFEKLSSELQDKNMYTWCKLPNGDISKTRIKDCWVTKKVRSLINVKLDNGSVIRCTEDHKFLMRDGSYKEAKDLNSGDSLMSDWRLCDYNLRDIYNNKEKFSAFLNLKGYFIYKITNKINGKVYIGDTIYTLESRLFSHPFGAHMIRYKYSDAHLYRSMRKYGLENFSIKILTFDDNYTEEYYIKLYDSYKNGYNGSPDGKFKGVERTGRIYIVDPTKTISRHVLPDEYEYWKSIGWEKGVTKSSIEKRKNTLKSRGYEKKIKINNGISERNIPKSDLDNFLYEGSEWVIGQLKSTSEKRNKKMKLDNKGFYNSDISSKAGKKGSEYHKINGSNIYNPEIRKKGQINGLKSQKENNTGIYNEDVRKLALKNSISTNKANKSGSAFNPDLQKMVREMATIKASETRYSNSIKLLDELLSKNMLINKDNYQMVKPKSSIYYSWETLCNKMTLDDKIKYNIDNHKVVLIEKEYLDSEIPVYDLEVENESHNFMLYDGEVFVHNCGKTLFMMSECLHMAINGAKCHWIALGDMNPGDFVQRMGAMYSGFSFAEAKMQMVNMFNGLSRLMKDRLGLTIVPSAEITVDEYLDYIMERIDDYDVFFIDYDSNFKPTKESNMYIEGGYLYDKLTTLTKAGKLVFIAAQPKISSWGKEELELPDVG